MLPADFLLVNEKNLIGRLISFGSRVRFTGDKRRHARWTHSALIVSEDGDLIEAVAKGVVHGHVRDYAGIETAIVSTARYATPETRVNAVKFAESCVGRRYGYASYVAYSCWALFGAGFSFGLDGEMTCSGLVSKSLERLGIIWPKDSTNMVPAHLAEFFNVP